ncbi:MAG: TIGR03790 family protein [Opitutus sp.]|nr:TIGR03790 family protein [Opitutus sp.]
MDRCDPDGAHRRRGPEKYAPSGHRITALVLCRGVPLKLTHDPALYAEARPFTSKAEFRTNSGAVDSELSALAQPNYPINAFVPNPLFQNDRPTSFEHALVVKVSRLDGPTVEDALALVDRALAAERTGLLGRAYVDLGGVHPDGDRWLASVVTQLEALGFDASVDREPGTMPASARCDAPVLYFGRYAGDLNGPFALPGFRFPPGAIALHIHSYSASTLRSPTTGWTGPLIARGVTATVGNVFEPYLQLTHRPELLLRALARGATLADAAYYALPALSWQTILIGDPLYRPFAVPLADQIKNLRGLPPPLAGYAVLRRMRELDAAKRPAEAMALALTAQRDAPSLAVAVALAHRLQASHADDGAGQCAGLCGAGKLVSRRRVGARARGRVALGDLWPAGAGARDLENSFQRDRAAAGVARGVAVGRTRDRARGEGRSTGGGMGAGSRQPDATTGGGGRKEVRGRRRAGYLTRPRMTSDF